MIRLVAVFMAVAACTAPARTGAGETCGLAPGDTTGWQLLTSHHGTFSISLPAEAREVRLPCIDSPCGQIAVGEMVISYDSGPMAGPGTELSRRAGETIDGRCRVATREGRAFLVGLGRYTSTVPTWGPHLGAPDTIRAGTVSVQAVLPIADRRGLYLYMHSPRSDDRAKFVTALRSVRVLRTK